MYLPKLALASPFDFGQASIPGARPDRIRNVQRLLQSRKMLRGHRRSVRLPPSPAEARLVCRCTHPSGSKRRAGKWQSVVRATIDLATAEPSTGGISKWLIISSQKLPSQV